MLRRRLTPLAAAAPLLLAACAGVDGTDGGVIRENVVEPGITAIDDSKQFACTADAGTIRTALEAYELFENEPAPDQQTLVDEGLLRSASPLWSVVDGELVPADPACGDVPTSVEAVDIVTSSPDVSLIDEVVSGFSPNDIIAMGGNACARELASVFIGASAFAADQGIDPATLEQVADGGYLPEPVASWQLVDEVLRPVEGSGCLDFVGDADSAP